jgi:hypothetical protein
VNTERNDHVLQSTPASDTRPDRPERSVYRSPQIHELGMLDQMQGSGGVFRDTVWPPGRYPRHD